MQTIGELIEQIINVNVEHFKGSSLDKEGLLKKVRRIPQAKLAWYRIIQPNQSKKQIVEKMMPKMTQLEYSILEAVAREHGVHILDLPSKLRTREVVDARMQAMAIFYTYFFYTFKRIGALFNRDHSTVIHAVETVNDFIEVDTAYTRAFYKSVKAAQKVAPDLFKVHERHSFHFKQMFQNRKITYGIRDEQEESLSESIKKQKKELQKQLKTNQLQMAKHEQIN
jgi:hypothetical protein